MIPYHGLKNVNCPSFLIMPLKKMKLRVLAMNIRKKKLYCFIEEKTGKVLNDKFVVFADINVLIFLLNKVNITQDSNSKFSVHKSCT